MRKRKVILLAQGSSGDVHPFMGLGLELKRRGIDVILAANGYYRDLIQRAGLEFLELGTQEEFLDFIQHPILQSPTKNLKLLYELLVLPYIEKAYRIIEECYVPGETVVAAHELLFGARMAQEKLGVPLATFHLAPACFRSTYDPPRSGMGMAYMPVVLRRLILGIADHVIEKMFLGEPFNAFRAELGLPPINKILAWTFSPDRAIGFFPAWFASKQVDWPKQAELVGFPLYDEHGIQPMATELEEFLESGDRPIIFNPGTANVRIDSFFEASLKACEILGKRAILLTRLGKQMKVTLPKWARHFAYVPFSELLPKSAVLVHIGGVGSIAEALKAGCPQLIMPMAYDQFDNAERVKRLGVGDVISSQWYCGKVVAKKLKQLLTKDGLRERCDIARALIANDRGIEKACELIELLFPPV